MVYQYSWRDEEKFAVAAQRVGERLAAIAEDEGGALHPRDVVADARHETSPLHPLFEWDDRKAAVAHRLTQAREIIGSIVVHVTGEEDSTLHYVRREASPQRPERFVAVTIRDGTDRYTAVPVAERARTELERWIKRYRYQAELVDAVRCAEDALHAIAPTVEIGAT